MTNRTSSEFRTERRSAVPPYRAAERGTLARNTGTEQRNENGTGKTLDLKALAEQALSRIASGTRGRNDAEQPAESAVPPPRNAQTKRRRNLVEILNTNRVRWCDLSSTLFWLRHRGWPALDVEGAAIAGETAWRAWVSRASFASLLAVRDRVAPAAPLPR